MLEGTLEGVMENVFEGREGVFGDMAKEGVAAVYHKSRHLTKHACEKHVMDVK